jgi:23S rRNA maturation-related 3'-5' exoribonuclease YhaM
MESDIVSTEEINEVKLKLGLLEKDVQVSAKVIERVSESIEKIQEMNLNLIKMITLHEQRHSQHEKVESELKEDIKELHSRISTQSKQLNDRIDQLEQHVTSRLDAIRNDLLQHKKQEFPDDKHGKKSIYDKLEKLNEWRWMVIGGLILAAWAIGELDILGKLIK